MKMPFDLRPQKWWQWVLAAAIAIGPNLPNIIDLKTSYDHDIPYASVPIAEEQNELWRKNYNCITNITDVIEVKSDTNISIKVVLCEKTGDVLLQVVHPNGDNYTRWISPTTFCKIMKDTKQYTWLEELFSTAYAAMEPKKVAIEIVCQWEDNEFINVVAKLIETGECVHKRVNKYTGKTKEEPIPCPTECPEGESKK